MADKKQTAEENYPLDPVIVIDMSARPAHTNFSRYLTFEDHAGRRKRLKVAFKKTGSLRWESDSFPDGIDALKSLTDTGNRSYWDRMFLENRGGRTTLPIDRLRIVMRYQNPPGLSPSHLNHAETNQEYTPQPGDYLERRGPDGAEHSMIMYRWLPGDPDASNTHDRYNRAIVFNGPWPVTLRLVRIHEDEKNDNKDFWLGKID